MCMNLIFLYVACVLYIRVHACMHVVSCKLINASRSGT
jgi:hypothetical protein